MGEQAPPRRRGPKPNSDRGAPSGYRVNARIRFELQVAAAFVGASTLQQTLDIAVQEFLDRLHQDAPGFTTAVASAERHQQHRAGLRNLPALDDSASSS